jgi:hypothetical protein
VLSQTVQFLSVPVSVAGSTATGLPQDSPPSVDRLTITPAPVTDELSGSDEISQVLCLASKAMDGSLTRAKGPVGDEKGVIAGRKPWVHVPPPSVDVAKPMSDDPPSKNRPTWKVDTIVFPFENVSGSTSVACWLVLFVKGSVLIRATATLATTGVAPTAKAKSAAPIPIEIRQRRTGTFFLGMFPPRNVCPWPPWPNCPGGALGCPSLDDMPIHFSSPPTRTHVMTTTNASGAYSIRLHPGTYVVIAGHADRSVFQRQLTVKTGDTVTLDLAMSPATGAS